MNETIETVRVIIRDKAERILFLHKSDNSKNPGKSELPGGQIEGKDGKPSTLEEQEITAIREVEEETGLKIENPIKVGRHRYWFGHHDGKLAEREVHVLQAEVPDETPKVTTNIKEDKHGGHSWATPHVLDNWARMGRLARNSDVFPLKKQRRKD